MPPTTSTAPVRLSVSVDAPIERAFEVFTKDLRKWWPVDTHSIDPERASHALMECRPGGRIVEVGKDGSETRWGNVLTWEPPTRVVFSWNPSLEARPDTKVEVTFTPEPAGGTRVVLEHRGWERLEEGAELRANYDTGWIPVLDRYRDLASATT